MKPSRSFRLILIVLAIMLVFIYPQTALAGQPARQSAVEITSTGQICNNRSECGTFSLTFDPAGGPVSGQVDVTWPVTNISSGAKIGEEKLSGKLTGNFEGGDGGQVSGSMVSGTWSVTYTVTCDTCVNDTRDVTGTPWLGTLKADGTGSGWIGNENITWKITYSADDFRIGAGGKKAGVKTPTKNVAATETPSSNPDGRTIKATGQFCDSANGFCGSIEFSFDPAGGTVTGSFTATYTPVNDNTVLKVNGTLDGMFAGQDGGQLGGTIPAGVWDWTCPSCGFTYATPASLAGYDWNGTLYANGTGKGTLYSGATWQVTFSAADFQAGLAGATVQKAPPPTATVNDYIQELYDGFTIEQGDKAWTDHELKMLHEVLDLLPPDLRKNLSLKSFARYSQGWDGSGKFVDYMGDYSAFTQALCPTCARSPQMIRIFDRGTKPSYFDDPSGDLDFKATVLHEIIHALQYYKDDDSIYSSPGAQNPLVKDYIDVSGPGLNGWYYSNSRWIYSPVNGNNPPTNYGMTNPMEDMSESAKMYVYDPAKLLQSSPQRYAYLRDHVFGGIEYDKGIPKK
jgi:hypothetical protein